MAGSLTPVGPANSAAGQGPARYLITGTSTAADNEFVVGVVLLGTDGNPYSASGGGGGGGAATIADGADVALGTTSDTAWTTGAGTLVGLNKATAAALLAGTAKVNVRKLDVIDDALRTSPDQASTATLSNVAASVGAGGVQLVAANAKSSSVSGRLGLIVANDSTASLFIAYAGSVSATSYTVKLLPGQIWTMDAPLYAGAVFGLWDAATGSARITELS